MSQERVLTQILKGLASVPSVALPSQEALWPTILNYIVTSNHIHLPVVDDGDRDVIPRSVQLVAGRTGQEYNQRKNRKGAFWEDRYHATAVERGDHLFCCLVYIDLHPVK